MATIHPEDDKPPALEGPVESEGESGDEDDPRAPPSDYKDLDKVAGYENVNFKTEVPQAPPKAKELYGEKPAMPFKEISEISDEECRQALMQLVNEHCCWGSGAVKNMKIDSIYPSTAFHYVLETFSECRTTKYVDTPYKGGFIDGPQNGIAPDAWQIPCSHECLFKNETCLFEVPHTSVLKNCQRCEASGMVECPRCRGRGRVTCSRCGGSGSVLRSTKNGSRYRRCYTCSGSGRQRCRRCNGEKEVKCPRCEGHKLLRVYIQLQVKFITHKSDYVLEMTALPDHLVKVVGGDIIFEQELDMVWPLTSYPVAEINDNSVRLIKKHKEDFSAERFIKQRHHLKAIPVTEVDYTYGGEKREYWVYGLERKVYCTDYPQQCCWGCQLL